MKVLQVSIMVAALSGATQGFAKVEQCRFINAKPEREACYDRQASVLAAKRAEAAAKQKAAVPERVKLEDEALSRRLKSICRGC